MFIHNRANSSIFATEKLYQPTKIVKEGTLNIADFLIIFTYHFETHKTSDLKTVNLLFFLKFAVLRDKSANSQYVIIIVGPVPLDVVDALRQLIKKSHLVIMYVPHASSDPCAVLMIFNAHKELRRYASIFILNDTVRGPFSDKWLNLYNSSLSETIAQVGAYINCNPAPHVQSFCYLMRMAEFLKHALPQASCKIDKPTLILKYEVGCSQSILRSGKSIIGIVPPYQAIDSVTRCPNTINPTMYGFANAPANPYDVIFFKATGTGVRSSTQVDVMTAQLLPGCLQISSTKTPYQTLNEIRACLYHHVGLIKRFGFKELEQNRTSVTAT